MSRSCRTGISCVCSPRDGWHFPRTTAICSRSTPPACQHWASSTASTWYATGTCSPAGNSLPLLVADSFLDFVGEIHSRQGIRACARYWQRHARNRSLSAVGIIVRDTKRVVLAHEVGVFVDRRQRDVGVKT